MPYRRLPNTDAARIRAFKTALEKANRKIGDKLVISFSLQQRISMFLPQFENVVQASQMTRDRQSEGSPRASKHTRKAKLYISHFIQVLNFCIIRGELSPQVRTFYGLKPSSSKIPSLNTDQEILEWGEKVIKGEQERIQSLRNGNAIYCPSIALVKVAFDKFKEYSSRQQVLRKSVTRDSAKVAALRFEADSLILELWNTIEDFYVKIDDEEERRNKCAELGIAYVYRRGELDRIRRKKEAESITLNLFE